MKNSPQNILVIKLRYIGDVLLCTPVFRALRTVFPMAKVVCLVNPGTEEILHNNPHVDEVLLIHRTDLLTQVRFLRKIRSRRFDCVLDLTNGDRSAIITMVTGAPLRIGFNHENRWNRMVYSQGIQASYGSMHMLEYHAHALQSLGIAPHLGTPEVFVGEQDEQRAYDLLQEHQLWNRSWIMVHPTARYWFKAWPPERFASLSDWFVKRGYPVVLVGNAQDQLVEEKIYGITRHKPLSFIGKTSLLELAALMKRSALFIGNDGGPMHIAAAVGCPVLALFGPSDPAVWGPRGKKTSVLYKGLDCRDCFYPGCFRGEESCMKQISVEEVCSAAIQMLS